MSATVIRHRPPLQHLSPRQRARWLAGLHGRGTRERMLASCYMLRRAAAVRGRESEVSAWHRLIEALSISLDGST